MDLLKQQNSKKNSLIVLLDRDGVINHDSPNYIKSPEEFVFLPGSVEAIARLTKAGYRIGIATNQSGVSRGYYSEQVLAAIHEKMLDHVRAAGGEIEAIEYCIHLPEHDCSCRKPLPGMLTALGKRFDNDLNDVPFIGDNISDVKAAIAVGARPMIVLSTITNLQELKSYPEIPVFPSLAECINYLLVDSN